MLNDRLLTYCQQTTGLDRQTIENIMSCAFSYIVGELAQGHTIDLGNDFGVFPAKLRESNLTEDSSRAPKEARYKVIFRENKGMQKRLKIALG